MARPDLWDDADNARAVTKELGRVSADLDQLDTLRSALEDAEALLELSEESAAEGTSDAALDAELVETVDALGHAARGVGTAVAVLRRVRRVRRGVRSARRRGWHGRAGLDRGAAAHVPALGRTARLHGRGRRGDRGAGGRAALGHLHRPRPLRLRAAGHRARRAPPGPDVALRLAAPAPDQLRLHGRHALPRRRVLRGGDRRERPAYRHLSLLGRRGPARQQDRLRRAPDPPADRVGGLLPERAQPAPEQGQGDADPGGQAGRAGPHGAPGRAGRVERRPRSTTRGATRSVPT